MKRYAATVELPAPGGPVYEGRREVYLASEVEAALKAERKKVEGLLVASREMVAAIDDNAEGIAGSLKESVHTNDKVEALRAAIKAFEERGEGQG